MAGLGQMARAGESRWHCCSTGVMQGLRISSVPDLLLSGCLSAGGLERVTLQHVSAVSCAACHSSGHPWACAELEWDAQALG